MRSTPPFSAIDHVQLAIPQGAEDRARAFYVGILGLEEVPKPERLAARGGVWLRSASVSIHLGVDEASGPSTKAHPAFLCSTYDAFVAYLRDSGTNVTPDEAMENGGRHCYVTDPFGNRIELVTRSS